ncbi:hypothetical protein CZ794_11525 [Psychrobacter sp. JB385]|nr:hypothetical protein CZ794_11525 [Psychrobacter sp. JB385]
MAPTVSIADMITALLDDLIRDEQRVSILFMIDGVLIIDCTSLLAAFYSEFNLKTSQFD